MAGGGVAEWSRLGLEGGGGGTGGGVTMTEGLDEVKTQEWPSLFAAASSFTWHLWSPPMGCSSVYLLHGFSLFTRGPLMAPLARPFQRAPFPRSMNASKDRLDFLLMIPSFSDFFPTLNGCSRVHYLSPHVCSPVLAYRGQKRAALSSEQCKQLDGKWNTIYFHCVKCICVSPVFIIFIS